MVSIKNIDAFYEAKKIINEAKKDISDSEIYLLLENANSYKDYTELVLNFNENLAKPQLFYENINKIIDGEPIQYVVNEAPFLSLLLYVDKRVLIPRPETEGLMLNLFKFIKENNLNYKNMLEICTGSGCIALSYKKEFFDASVYTSDISSDAIEVAKLNAKNNNLDINFFVGDKLEPILKLNKKFDVFVSNPPYVENKNDIEEKVKRYEPMNAIYVEDGTTFYEYFFKCHKLFLNKDAIMAFEINYDQEEKLKTLISLYFKNENIQYKFVKDIYGMTRYLFIIRGYKNGILN